MLALGAPGGGPAADRFAAERRLMFWADTFGRPALVEQPGFGRVAKFGTDLLQRFTGDKAHFLMEAGELLGSQRCGSAGGRKAGAPKDFVGHPVTDAGKTLLVEQRCLEGKARMATEKFAHVSGGESARGDRRRDGCPPIGRFGTAGKEDATELAGIVEDQSAISLVEDEMIVLFGLVGARCDGQFAGHAEVNTEPEVTGEAEEHLFAGGFRGQELLAGE